MDKKEMEDLINGIQTKLGKENTALIADDLGKLTVYSGSLFNEIDNIKTSITKLKEDKENLQNVNFNLLQQIPIGEDIERKKQIEPEEKKNFSFKTAFDEKGRFKK